MRKAPGGRLDLVAGPVHGGRDDRLHMIGAWDVGLVVTSQVAKLPFVEEHDAGQCGETGGGQGAGRFPGVRNDG